MAIVLRNEKGSPLSYSEGDGNFSYLLTTMSGSSVNIIGTNVNITGSKVS